MSTKHMLGVKEISVMDRRRFLRSTATVTTPFVAGCIGDSGDGEDGEAGNGRDENGTTTGEVIAAGGGTTADGRTTEAAPGSTRTTGKTDTTAQEHTETVPGRSTENPYRPPTLIATPTRNGLAIVGIHPAERQREFISGEYVTLQNTGSEPLDLAGYTITYPNGSTDPAYTYALTLEPGARVYTLSRAGEDTTLTTSPPGYLRFAGYDNSLLDEASGTVVVANADDETVLEHSYDRR
jgi:hypothetical protein